MFPRPVPSVVSVALLAAIWFGTWVDYRAHIAEHQAQFYRLGRAVAAAARGSIQHVFRGGRYDPLELEPAVEELRAGLEVERLDVFAGDVALVRAHSAVGSDVPTVDFALDFAAPQPRGVGRHGPGPPLLLETPRETLSLRLSLSRASLDERLATDQRRFLGLASALSVVWILSLFVMAARSRSAALAGELGRAQEEVRGLEFLRRLGAGLAHETRNPLGLVRGFSQQIADGAIDPTRVREVGRTLVDEVDRTVARLDEFLLLSRPAELRRENFDVRELIAELAHLLEPDLEALGARVELAPFTLDVNADREQTRRLFMNLMLNATQALERNGTLRVESRGERDANEVWVVDDGPGVPEPLRATMFEPYVSGRRSGTGLGLAIARRIAVEHGWSLRHEPVTPRGAAFVVRIPKS